MRPADTDGQSRAHAVRDIDQLANTVIGLICDRQAVTPEGARQYVLDYLLRAVLSRQDFNAPVILAEMKGLRLAVDMLIDTYIPLTAVELGDMWLRSEASFAQVTIGALRLQTLLGEASAEQFDLQPHPMDTLCALIVVPPDEQHFLGASVAAAQLRRYGVSVTMLFGESAEGILAEVEMGAADMLLFSCARVESLEVVRETVQKIRMSMDPVPVMAVGGSLKGDDVGIRKMTDVDLFTRSVKDVISFCTKRKKALNGS